MDVHLPIRPVPLTPLMRGITAPKALSPKPFVVSGEWDQVCVLRCKSREYHLCTKEKSSLCVIKDGVYSEDLSLDGKSLISENVYKVIVEETKLVEVLTNGKYVSLFFLGSPDPPAILGEYLSITGEITSAEDAIFQARRNQTQVLHAQNHRALAVITGLLNTYSINSDAIARLVAIILAHQEGESVSEEDVQKSIEELNLILHSILSHTIDM